MALRYQSLLPFRMTGDVLLRKRVHQPSDPDGDNQECEKREEGILQALDVRAFGKECKGDGNNGGKKY
jgi:hypothetical protein